HNLCFHLTALHNNHRLHGRSLFWLRHSNTRSATTPFNYYTQAHLNQSSQSRWIKQKSVKAPYSTGLRVVPRPPIFNPVPHYQPHLKPAFPIGPSIVKPPTAKYGPGSPPMAQTFVDEHNKVRDVYGVPHLVWNSQLIPTAQRLAAACVFRHTDNNPYGENIAAGQTTPQDVVSQSGNVDTLYTKNVHALAGGAPARR
ncbi:hypothetical protein PSTT_14798, partial [Puccinia striiformis]